MKNIGSVMPKLNRIEIKCDAILRRLFMRSNGEMDNLINKMNAAAMELERMARTDIRK